MAAVSFRIEQERNVGFIVPPEEWVGTGGESDFREAVERLKEQGVGRIAVDFSEVSYMDSSALGQLVHGYSILKKHGVDLKLVRPSRRIIDLLRLTRLLTVFEVCSSREEASQSGQQS